MFMRFWKASQAREEKSDVIFNATLKPFVARLLKVKTRSCELHQCVVDVLFAILRKTKTPKKCRVRVMELSLQGMIRTLLKERGCLLIDTQGFEVTSCVLFDDRD